MVIIYPLCPTVDHQQQYTPSEYSNTFNLNKIQSVVARHRTPWNECKIQREKNAWVIITLRKTGDCHSNIWSARLRWFHHVRKSYDMEFTYDIHSSSYIRAYDLASIQRALWAVFGGQQRQARSGRSGVDFRGMTRPRESGFRSSHHRILHTLASRMKKRVKFSLGQASGS